MAQGKVRNAVRCPFCPHKRLIASSGWYPHLKGRHPQVPLTTPHPSKGPAAAELAAQLRAPPPAPSPVAQSLDSLRDLFRPSDLFRPQRSSAYWEGYAQGLEKALDILARNRR